MTTLEIKKILIHKIAEINDISFLKALKTILETKAENEIIPLSNEQKKEIMESKQNIEANLYREHNKFDKVVTAWLNEK